MRTGRSLTICRGEGLLQGVAPSGGWLLPGGVPPFEWVPLSWEAGASFLGGLLPRGSPSWGCFIPRGCLLPGGGWYPSMHWGRPPSPVDRITDTSKNITLATTSLRPVKISVMNWSSDRRHRTHVFWLLSIKPTFFGTWERSVWKAVSIEIVCSYQTVISPSYVHYSPRKPLDLEEVLLCNVQSDNIQRLSLLVRSDQCHLTHENVVYIGKKRSASLQT